MICAFLPLLLLPPSSGAAVVTSLVPFENCSRARPTQLFHAACLAASGAGAAAALAKVAALDPLLCQPPRHARFVSSAAAGGGGPNCSSFGFSNPRGERSLFGVSVARWEEPWCEGLARGTYCVGPPMVRFRCTASAMCGPTALTRMLAPPAVLAT